MTELTLTDYLVALMTHPAIDRANPDAAAIKYNLPITTARYYLADERQRRLSRSSHD